MEELIHGQYCVICNTAFVPKHHLQKCCSGKCRTKHMNTKKSPFDQWRFKVFARDNFKCVYCGASSVQDGKELTIDHVYPRVKGGANDIYNIVTCCKQCNRNKFYTVLTRDKIISIWKRNIILSNEVMEVEDYAGIKAYFDKMYPMKNF